MPDEERELAEDTAVLPQEERTSLRRPGERNFAAWPWVPPKENKRGKYERIVSPACAVKFGVGRWEKCEDVVPIERADCPRGS